jgi:hypothetical protein
MDAPADGDVARLVEQAREAGRAEALRLLTAEWRDAYLAAARRPARPARPAEEGSGWWVYGVLGGDDTEALPETVAGVVGAPVEVVRAGGLAALVSEVPLEQFGDEALRANLEDLRWLEAVARAHEAVLETAMGAGTVVPVRLCTIYRSRERVTGFLAEQSEGMRASLETLRGRSEWGVKLFARNAGGDPAAGAEPPEGGAYLARRRQERDARDQARRAGEEAARRVHERVQRVAVASRINSPQAPEAHGREARMLLNAAYLVADERHDALGEAIEELVAELEPENLDVELTGPWPPYNFLTAAAEALP